VVTWQPNQATSVFLLVSSRAVDNLISTCIRRLKSSRSFRGSVQPGPVRPGPARRHFTQRPRQTRITRSMHRRLCLSVSFSATVMFSFMNFIFDFCPRVCQSWYVFVFRHFGRVQSNNSRLTPRYIILHFLPRDALHSADYVMTRSVRLSVRLPHTGTVLKRLNILSNFSYHLTAPHSIFSLTKRYGNIPTEASNAEGMKNSQFWPISRFISETMQDRVSY